MCMSVRMSVFVHVYVLHASVFVHVYVYMCDCVYVMFVCVCVCVFACGGVGHVFNFVLFSRIVFNVITCTDIMCVFNQTTILQT